ncbi:MAG TPA: universal stress protein [Cellulomonas sp.]|uniref:universal stress protein n=1 Tax=Cellulomonas sp. TaxID=40001 RepID=UPI002E342AA7|nr:universal stress protein [Cellulomonas sp.]HEX5333099.1 universal stress protein [Cellulomonas sp.]
METPQPSPSRMTPFSGHPIVVAVVPHEPELVALTAASWSQAAGGVPVYFAYVDPTRFTVEEHADGTVRHADIDPDAVDDSWLERQEQIEASLTHVLGDSGISWEFRYLAGRPDRALTHLARAVDAAAIVVGTRAPGPGARLREVVEGSIAVQLSHHQHRPVLVVPLSVVDWQTPLWR